MTGLACHRRRSVVLVLLAGALLAFPAWSAAEKLTAVVQAPPFAYAGRDLLLDGSRSTAGAGVTYRWACAARQEAEAFAITNETPVVHVVAAKPGHYGFTLTVGRGGETVRGSANLTMLDDPAHGTPDYDGTAKVCYKQATNVLGGVCNLPLYLFKPQGWTARDRRGVVLLFHGGGWGGGTADRFLQEAGYYASRGLIGMTAEYRVGSRQGTGPGECVADAKSAVRYLRRHAAELGVDSQRIAVGGESAGGHMAAAVATLPAYNDAADDLAVSCVPNALLLYYPFAMETTAGNRRDDLSPLHFVGPRTPPTLYIVGDQDGIGRAEWGVEWRARMARAGNTNCTLLIMAGAHHPSGNHDIMKGCDYFITRQTDLFLAAQGFLEGQPTVSEAIGRPVTTVDPAETTRNKGRKP